MKKIGTCLLILLCHTFLHAFAQRDTLIHIKTVEVTAQTAAQQVKQQAYSVEVLDARQIRDRNADLNRLLDAMPGIRVRETGGMGSSFNYSIHGLSGKSIRFFVDGIPMETFGTGFSINNFPLVAIDRIEVYKGVIPAALGGDALGGAINIITRKDFRSYLDASYSYGSYNTHRAALAGNWRSAATGFTTTLQAAYNYSDNNYKVWGTTVEVADASGRPRPGNHKYPRFNDDFSSLLIKASAGFTDKKWADQLLLSLTVSDLHKGIQTGRTMAYVYGDVRYRENFLMPDLRYTKKDLFVKGLQANVFVAVNTLKGATTDTGSRKYNWAGEVIAAPVNGELNGIYAQKSRYSFTDKSSLAVVNLAYQLRPQHTLSLNYTGNHTGRTGKDDIALADWTIPFREPQHITKQVTGLSYEATLLEEKWTNIFFIKNFRYRAEANIYDYNSGQQKELIRQQSSDNTWGVGYGTKIKAGSNTLVKFSIEEASRLPDATELLGDGNTILNAPALKPEQSLNINASLQRHITIASWQFDAEAGLFYRNTRNLIWLGEGNLFGTARYENINKIRSMGAEAALVCRYGQWLEISANATYQDVRNRQQYTSSGAANLVYNDKMKNMPSLMANGEIRLRYPDLFGKATDLSLYVNTHYVEQYYLNWPSLGDPSTKKVIPEQFVQDAGVTYAFNNNRCSISLECRNIMEKQVYDNYLLQKPGRFSSIKIRYFLHQFTKPI